MTTFSFLVSECGQESHEILFATEAGDARQVLHGIGDMDAYTTVVKALEHGPVIGSSIKITVPIDRHMVSRARVNRDERSVNNWKLTFQSDHPLRPASYTYENELTAVEIAAGHAKSKELSVVIAF